MKYKIMTVLALVAVGVFADINVAWKSSQNHVVNDAGAALIGDGTYAALIWVSDAAVPVENLVLTPVGISTDGTEFLLAFTTDTVGGGLSLASQNFANSAVGGNDINAGYFFTRVFDTGVLSTDNYYVQAQVVGPALIDAGSPADPAKVYNENVFEGPAFPADYGQVDVKYSVIPEPATLGMVAVFGGGLLVIRRKLML